MTFKIGLKAPVAGLLVPLLFAAVALLAATSATASPFAPNTSHVGEDHSNENHRGEILTQIDLTSANVSRSDFRNADLTQAVLDFADASRTDFRNATLANAWLRSTVLDRADLRGAGLVGANLANASLDRVNARGADFASAVLDGVAFGQSDLRDANLDSASLIGVLFGTTSLRNANLANSNLVGADLRNVTNYGSANFIGAYYDLTTLLPTGFDTSGMNFVPEPSSAILLGLGLLGLASPGRRPRRRE